MKVYKNITDGDWEIIEICVFSECDGIAVNQANEGGNT
jgi:hypothetical protein